MSRHNRAFAQLTGLVVAVILLASPASAQPTVSQTDIQRLQDEVYQAGSDLTRLRGSTDQVSQLQGEFDELREEVIYLKVKLRKEGTVARREYADLRDRIQNLRSRARGETTGTWTRESQRPPTTGTGAATGAGVSGGVSGGTGGGVAGGAGGGAVSDERRTQETGAIPVGYELDVRLQSELSSATAQPEQRFEATTVADVYRGSEVLIPAGSLVRGVVSSVEKATRTDRTGRLTLAFDQITIRGREYPLRGIVTQALESEGVRGEVGRIGAGGAIGGIIGGIIGGVKGALLGVLIGGGGTMAATPGKDVTVPSGTLLRVRLDQPPSIR